MSKPEEIPYLKSIELDPKPPSRSSSDEVTVADRGRSDLNQVPEELSNQFRNVGLDDSANELSVPIIIVEGHEETDLRELGRDQKEEEDGSERENTNEERMIMYPVRPDAEDCSFYLRTGSCKYGSSCKFNHPVRRKLQIGREIIVREREEDAENLKLMECKYYFRTGGCKYGESCRFSHMEEHNSLASRTELNFLGLPIRPGEKECPYYMRNGSCKFGSDCKFNHPDPTAIGGSDSPLFCDNNGGSFSPNAPPSQVSSPSWSSPRHMNGTGTAPFIPTRFTQNRGASPQASEWNGYQASSAYPPETSVVPPSSYPINNSLAETSSFSQYQQQMPEEFPDRPDQPECPYYLKTGDCKFKYRCRYHHPKNRLPKQAPFSFNDKGLPLRPDQSMCTHYSRYGICKFGPACRFDHSMPSTFSPSSSLTIEAPQAGANGNEDDTWH